MKNGDGCWQTVKGTELYKWMVATNKLTIINAVDEWYTIEYSLFTAIQVMTHAILVWIHCKR